MCYPWRCPGRWPVCIQLYGHGAEAPIDGYCTRILAFRGLSACQGSLNSSKIVVNEMVLTCLKCPWIQCFQGIIRFWLDFFATIMQKEGTFLSEFSVTNETKPTPAILFVSLVPPFFTQIPVCLLSLCAKDYRCAGAWRASDRIHPPDRRTGTVTCGSDAAKSAAPCDENTA